jgi:formate-dependent phosphoribosylglycinamide formyltransferase (GAR transformylase)
MMTKKRVLVINLGWEQEPLIDKLASRDVELYGVHCNEKYSKKFGYSEVLICDFRDLSAISQFADNIEAEAVVSDECDYSYFAQALVAESRKLPGPTLSEAQRATNKWIQRESAKHGGVLQPGYRLCRFFTEVELAASELGYPVVVKPVDNRGSFGVNKVDEPSKLLLAYHLALANSHSRLVLVEEFIAGVHITVDGYCFQQTGHRSLALATKKMLGGEKQVAMEIVYPGELPESVYQHALHVNDQVVQALGYKFGMTHAEYMVTPSGACYLIEIANRGGGVYTSATIVSAVSGIDATQQLVFDSLGVDDELFNQTDQSRNGVCLSFFQFEPGVFDGVRGADIVESDSRTLAFRLMIKPGDTIGDIDSDAVRHGFVIASGTSANEARNSASDLKSSIYPLYRNKR